MKRREFIISEKCLQNGALPFLFGFADRHCPRAFVGIRTRHRISFNLSSLIALRSQQ